MRRAVLVGLVGIAIAVVILLSTRDGKPRASVRDVEQAPAPAAETTAAIHLEPVESTLQRGAIEVADAPIQTVSVTREDSAPASLEATEQIRLTGTVVVIDDKDVEHPTQNGTLELALSDGSGGSVVQANVVDGRFELDVRPSKELSVFTCRLAGRLAFPVGPESVPFPDDHVVHLRFRWAAPLTLHVRDAETRADLSGVEVVFGTWESNALTVPPEQSLEDPAVSNGQSPLPLPAADEWASRLFVRARGYAWSQIKFDVKVGGDYFADLVPACTLALSIEGDTSDNAISIRLIAPKDGRPMVDVPLKRRDRLSLESLPPGEYEVSAQIGEWYRQPAVLAKAPVVLIANALTDARLVIAPPPARETADAAGVFIVPNAWNTPFQSLSVERRGPATRAKSDLTLPLREQSRTDTEIIYAWRMKGADVGRYELSIYEPSYAWILEVPAGGAAGIEIRLPPPCDVSIRVVDDETSEDVIVDDVSWYAKRPPDTGGWSMSTAKRNPETGRYDARCPLGDVEFSTFPSKPNGYDGGQTSATLHPGANAVVLRLPKATEMAIVMMDGTRELPLDFDTQFEITPVSGNGMTGWHSWGNGRMRIQVTEPGSYKVKLSNPPPGYVAPDEQIVDIKRGSMTDVVIRLTRKP